MQHRIYLVFICWLGFAAAAPTAHVKAQKGITAEDREFFESRIRPVLVERCYSCHNSTDAAEGSFALDDRRAIRKGGDSGPAIVPGKPRQSRLLKVIRHEIEGQKMPQDGPKLDPKVVADFQRWIAIGAPDPRDRPPTAKELKQATSWEAIFQKRKQWWSFQPIQSPQPPQEGAKHPIDRFILARLKEHGLPPARPALKSILVRRLYFALLGLPPTPEQIDRFLEDQRPGAYQRLVDELLNSKHFGERWARHWMDWIRYAESHGSEGDPPIAGAYLYRDYLIRALNADTPFDQLVREHLAGDLLPFPRRDPVSGVNESMIATAHWRMVFHGFAPTDALDEKMRFTDDQINTFSKAFLGLTVSCARCHHHKFDAISQHDYYALFGVFGSTRPGRAVIDPPKKLHHNRARLGSLKPRIREAVAQDWLAAALKVKDQLLRKNDARENPTPPATDPRSVWRLFNVLQRETNSEKEFSGLWRTEVEKWRKQLQARQQDRNRPYAQRFELTKDNMFKKWYAYGVGLRSQPSPAGEFAVAAAGDKALLGVYPKGVYSHLLSAKHAAALTSRDVSLDGQYELWLLLTGGGDAMSRFVVQNYPRSGTVYPVTDLKDKQAGRWRWQKYDLSYWSGDKIHIELTTANDAPLLVKNKPRSWFGIREALLVKKGQPPPLNPTQQLLDPLFTAAADNAPDSLSELADLYVTAITAALKAWRKNAMTDGQAMFLQACMTQGLLPNRLEKLSAAKPLIEQYRRWESEIPIPTRVPTVVEWKGQNQPLFERGNHKRPTMKTPRRFLEAVDATPYQTSLSGRRELAEDLLRDDNPFTRRVIVNRLWHHLFGRGIVATPDNFGRLGEIPSHPQLLDYLATRFQRDGWSIKQMIRLIVTSETWRQSVEPADQRSLEKDPQNRWLSRFPLRRLEAEAIRDSILAVSGSLDRAMYGEPVSGEVRRRSVYVRVIRNNLDPFLTVFDSPTPFSAKGRRDVTNVPAQSLMMMNNPFVTSAAQRFAANILADETLTSDVKRVDHLWQAALGRAPSPAERDDALRFVQELRSRYGSVAAEKSKIDREMKKRRMARRAILEPVRKRLLKQLEKPLKNKSFGEIDLKPIAHWDFRKNLDDSVGQMHVQLHDGARADHRSFNPALVVDGRGWASTTPSSKPLGAKTLTARVLLDTLDQRGGGVLTVQTLDGITFDSIVFGERRPRRWMAGSNFFTRTKDFGAAEDRQAAKAPVHIAIVYRQDGTIQAYRNGKPYGEPYRTSLQTFAKGRWQAVFGLRHGVKSGGNRMLKGKILEAAVYDRPLTESEVLAAASGGSPFVSTQQVLAELSEQERSEIQRLEKEITLLRDEKNDLGEPAGEPQIWSDLAHSIFNLKEFIYVR